MIICLLLTKCRCLSTVSIMNKEKRRQLLITALDTFFKYGYKRVEMKEIAEIAGISRPGLYLYFKTKEEIFNAAILQYSENKLAEISENIDDQKGVEDKLAYAFEVWCVRGFDRSLKSPEAKEVSDSSYEFAREALEEGYGKLESIIADVLTAEDRGSRKLSSHQKKAHILVSATRGFKIVARSSAELRKMIKDLLVMSL